MQFGRSQRHGLIAAEFEQAQLLGLRAARADNTHERRLARYASVDLLIIDDLGLRALCGEEPLDLYEIIRQCYE